MITIIIQGETTNNNIQFSLQTNNKNRIEYTKISIYKAKIKKGFGCNKQI